MYFNVNCNVFFLNKKVHLLVSEFFIYQNARCNNKKKEFFSYAPFSDLGCEVDHGGIVVRFTKSSRLSGSAIILCSWYGVSLRKGKMAEAWS